MNRLLIRVNRTEFGQLNTGQGCTPDTDKRPLHKLCEQSLELDKVSARVSHPSMPDNGRVSMPICKAPGVDNQRPSSRIPP